jgi:hypothetical protein
MLLDRLTLNAMGSTIPPPPTVDAECHLHGRASRVVASLRPASTFDVTIARARGNARGEQSFSRSQHIFPAAVNVSCPFSLPPSQSSSSRDNSEHNNQANY